jgi:hypothetical protein
VAELRQRSNGAAVAGLGAPRSRVALIDWLADGADEMTPGEFQETLADVINGRRQVPGLADIHQASELLQRWLTVR